MLRMTGKTHHAVHRAMLCTLLGLGLAAAVFSVHAERFRKDPSVSIADVAVESSNGSSQVERNTRGGRLLTSLSAEQAREALSEALARLQLGAKPREPEDDRLLTDWVLWVYDKKSDRGSSKPRSFFSRERERHRFLFTVSARVSGEGAVIQVEDFARQKEVDMAPDSAASFLEWQDAEVQAGAAYSFLRRVQGDFDSAASSRFQVGRITAQVMDAPRPTTVKEPPMPVRPALIETPAGIEPDPQTGGRSDGGVPAPAETIEKGAETREADLAEGEGGVMAATAGGTESPAVSLPEASADVAEATGITAGAAEPVGVEASETAEGTEPRVTGGSGREMPAKAKRTDALSVSVLEDSAGGPETTTLPAGAAEPARTETGKPAPAAGVPSVASGTGSIISGTLTATPHPKPPATRESNARATSQGATPAPEPVQPAAKQASRPASGSPGVTAGLLVDASVETSWPALLRSLELLGIAVQAADERQHMVSTQWIDATYDKKHQQFSIRSDDQEHWAFSLFGGGLQRHRFQLILLPAEGGKRSMIYAYHLGSQEQIDQTPDSSQTLLEWVDRETDPSVATAFLRRLRIVAVP